MKTFGLRDDNDNGSLVNHVNYVASNPTSIIAIAQASVRTNLDSVPFCYLAYDLTTNGLGSGIDMNDSPLIFSTETATATTSLYVDCFLAYSAICVAGGAGNISINY